MLVQCSLLLVFVRWPSLPTPSGAAGQDLVLSLDPPAARTSDTDPFTSDPRTFALPDRVGFSGTASRALPSPEYRLVEWRGTARWLAITNPGARLGTAPNTPRPSVRTSGAPLVSGPLDPASTPLVLRRDTAARVQGGLAGRTYQASGTLQPVAGTDILSATVIELQVSPGGDVLRARLTSSSGNREADLEGLRWARQLQFNPVGPETTPANSAPDTWTSGELHIFWRVEPSLR
jgi:TonB family protein